MQNSGYHAHQRTGGHKESEKSVLSRPASQEAGHKAAEALFASLDEGVRIAITIKDIVNFCDESFEGLDGTPPPKADVFKKSFIATLKALVNKAKK